jgi:dynein heavy chain
MPPPFLFRKPDDWYCPILSAILCRFKKEMRRFFYVTPTSYLQLLDSFKGLLVRKREEVAAARK